MARDSLRTAENDAVQEIAADWFARLQNPQLSMDETLSWQSWLSADERHARAFQRIEEVWQRFSGMPKPALLEKRHLAADDYDGSISIGDYLNRKPMRRPKRRMQFALAASVLMALGLSVALYLNSRDELLQTRIGENREVRLTDGSSVLLGGHTRVKLALDEHERRLSLEQGEALFKVARDPRRPFSVQAGNTLVTAVGTTFNVRRADDRVMVAVVEGKVRVKSAEPAAPARNLDVGDSATFGAHGVESSRHVADSAAVAVWPSGRLAFEREPLRYVLEDVNRYAAKPIVVSSADVADLKITGTVLSSNIDGWVASLESAFGLQAVDEADRIVLKPRAPARSTLSSQ